MSYHITYAVKPHPEGIKRSAIPEGHGACDAIVIGSIIHREDGGVSYATVTADGRTGEELTPIELFKFWSQLANSLAEQLPGGWQKKIAAEAFEKVRAVILMNRLDQEPT